MYVTNPDLGEDFHGGSSDARTTPNNPNIYCESKQLEVAFAKELLQEPEGIRESISPM